MPFPPHRMTAWLTALPQITNNVFILSFLPIYSIHALFCFLPVLKPSKNCSTPPSQTSYLNILNWTEISLNCAWPKAYYKRQDLAEERDCWDLQREVVKQKSLRSKRLHSIPEVEEESDSVDSMGQQLYFDETGQPGTTQRRMYSQDSHLPAGKSSRHLQRQRSSPRFTDSRYYYNTEERSLGRPNRQNTKSPDSGLDCGSEEEGSLGRGHRGYYTPYPMRGPVRIIHCEGPVERRALAMGRKRTLTRQSSVDEDYSDMLPTSAKSVHTGDFRNREHFGPCREAGLRNYTSEARLNKLDRVYYSPHRDSRVQTLSRLNRDRSLVCDLDFLPFFYQQTVTILLSIFFPAPRPFLLLLI